MTENQSQTFPSPVYATQAPPRLHLDFLDGLRGLAALYVALCHASLLLDANPQIPHWASLVLKPLVFGHYSVAVFIVLSGYCLMLPVALSADKQLRGGWQSYLLRRSRRILPPYYVAFALSLLLLPWVTQEKHLSGVPLTEADHLTWGNIVSHLLLVHNWNGIYFQSIDGPLWSVATEWQIYFFLPFVLLPVWRRAGLATVVAVAFTIGLAPHFLCTPAHSLDWACPWYLGLFALGMAGALFSAGRDLRLEALSRKVSWGALTAVCVVAVAAGHYLTPRSAGFDGGDSHWYMDILCGLLSMCLLVWCGRRAQSGFWLTNLLQSPPAMALGAMSYSVYLVHQPLEQGAIFMLWAHHLPFLMLLAATFLLVIPAAIGLCYLFHRAFERPFMPGKPRTAQAAEKAAISSPAP